jgi:hypothetical protein
MAWLFVALAGSSWCGQKGHRKMKSPACNVIVRSICGVTPIKLECSKSDVIDLVIMSCRVESSSSEELMHNNVL